MRKIFLLVLSVISMVPMYAQFTVDTAIVPQYAVGHGKYATLNTQRLPFYTWVQLSGLNADSTYIYKCYLDSSANTLSTGAGQTIWIDMAHDSVYTSTTAAFSKASKSGTFKADGSGKYQGWFSVIPDNDARFRAGNNVYFKILTNGGTSSPSDTIVSNVASLKWPIQTLNFRDSSKLHDCSFYFDSTYSAPKSFVFLYDNTTGAGRPIAGAIVESDGINFMTPSSGGPYIINTYKRRVDGKASIWGTAIPDTLPTGIRRLEYRLFASGKIDSVSPVPTDTQGVWPSGVVTRNPSNDTAGIRICSLCPTTIDMAINNIDLPDTAINCNRASTNVSILLLNNSSIPQNAFYVYYRLNNGPIVTENVGSLTIQGRYNYKNYAHYQFKTPATLTTSGLQQTIKIWVSVPGDINRTNDTAVYGFYNISSPLKDTIGVSRDTVKIYTVDSFYTNNQSLKYKWMFGDTSKALDTFSNTTHIYRALGTFKVTLIGNAGKCGKDTVYHNVVVVDHYTGIHNIKQVQHTVSLYPNPASSNFTMTGILNVPTSVMVYDLLGQQVHCNYEYRAGNLVVYTSHLATGQYFIRIVTGGNTLTRRFTKD